MSAAVFPAEPALEKCRDVPERDARLACFDSATRDRGGPGTYLSNTYGIWARIGSAWASTG